MVCESAQLPALSQTCFVRIVVGLQVLNWSSLKSFSTAVKDCEERVCGRNVLMQPLNPIAARSTPTSNASLSGSVEVSTPFLSRQAQPPQPVVVGGRTHVSPLVGQSLAVEQNVPEVLQMPPLTDAFTAGPALGLIS